MPAEGVNVNDVHSYTFSYIGHRLNVRLKNFKPISFRIGT